MTDVRDTIFALSSGPPPSAIAVVRVSGPRARVALEHMVGRLPEPRRATLVKIRHPTGDSWIIDEGLVLWFPGPKSETGEDVVEFQVHGGRAVIAAMLSALTGFTGFRLAEPGEFTRRAFDNGRMDLTAVEGLADLIAADTDAQRRQALRQLRGSIAEQAEAWRARLIEARALLEAGIDFSDEGDVPKSLARQALAIIRPVAEAIGKGMLGRGERLRDGLQVAIAGAPNVGKSTLLNRFAKREAAIVSPYAGTTRDVIEVHLDLAGYPVILADTAGLRAAGDEIEAEGVRRARARAAEADLKLMVLDTTRPEEASAAVRALVDAETLVVANKIDLVAEEHASAWTDRVGATPALRTSVKTGAGLEALLARLTDELARRFHASGAPLITRARHRAALEECLAALRRYDATVLPELAAEDLRLAARALGRITGRVDVEDLLDIIFRDFCIGK